jgi:hypothetical protein
MDGDQFLSTVREDEATALSRLGSDKFLIAATGADLGTAPVLRTVARSAVAARDSFRTWAEEATGDPVSAFEAAADTERDHYERVVAAMPEAADDERGNALADDPNDGEAPAAESAMAAAEGTVERVAAGLVGRPLVLDRTHLQVVSFFVNEADDRRADLARDLRSDASDQLEGGVDLLDSLCDSDDDWERANRAAGLVVADAYDAYATALESMGVDPKPVC